MKDNDHIMASSCPPKGDVNMAVTYGQLICNCLAGLDDGAKASWEARITHLA